MKENSKIPTHLEHDVYATKQQKPFELPSGMIVCKRSHFMAVLLIVNTYCLIECLRLFSSVPVLKEVFDDLLSGEVLPQSSTLLLGYYPYLFIIPSAMLCFCYFTLYKKPHILSAGVLLVLSTLVLWLIKSFIWEGLTAPMVQLMENMA